MSVLETYEVKPAVFGNLRSDIRSVWHLTKFNRQCLETYEVQNRQCLATYEVKPGVFENFISETGEC